MKTLLSMLSLRCMGFILSEILYSYLPRNVACPKLPPQHTTTQKQTQKAVYIVDVNIDI